MIVLLLFFFFKQKTAYEMRISDWSSDVCSSDRDNDMQRWWLITDESDPAPSLPAGNTARWQADDIAAGLPWVQAATQDLFIPQTLNLDLIDGVSFTKGCDPGQEVVARR